MSKRILTAITALTICVSPALATDNVPAVKERLLKAFPKINLNDIRPTPIDGLYEIESGDNIFYYFPKTDNLLVGNIYSKEGKNITAEATNKILERKLASIEVSKAIKIGNGKNVVIEFTDPDCPYCRKSYEFFKTKSDITHYVFLSPSPSLHPKATEKAEWIMSQKDKVAAFNEVFSGKHDTASLQGITAEGKNLLKEQLDTARMVKVSGTPMFFVNNTFISGMNAAAINQALASGSKQVQEK